MGHCTRSSTTRLLQHHLAHPLYRYLAYLHRQMRDAGGAGPSTAGSLASTAKLTSSSRYADVMGKVGRVKWQVLLWQ